MFTILSSGAPLAGDGHGEEQKPAPESIEDEPEEVNREGELTGFGKQAKHPGLLYGKISPQQNYKQPQCYS